MKLPVLLALVVVVQAQVPFLGPCPQPPVQKNFDKQRYLGTWFEQSNYFTYFQIGVNCVKATYGDAGENVISVLNEALGEEDSEPVQVNGTARILSDSGEAKLRVEFPNSPNTGSGPNYVVLFTDYDNVAIVFSCDDFSEVHTQVVWILTRQRHPTKVLVSSAKNMIRKFGLRTDLLKPTQQKNCSN